MKIAFIVNPVFDGWEPDDIRLGGTERGVQEWGEELVKRGHRVLVFRNGQNGVHYNGVIYIDRKNYFTDNGNADFYVNVKSPDVLPDGKPMLYYTNETDVEKHDLSAYDGVIHISQFAADNFPVNNPNVFIVPHGYDPTKIYPGKKIPKQCLYASSPDRGLDWLLEAWPTVVAAHPDATLLVTYGVDKGPDIPGVTYLGDVDEDMMAELYGTSQVWTYPCKGGELFCITGIKAQAAGAVPVIIPEMALKETVKHGYFTTREHYAEVLSQVLDDSNVLDFVKRREAMVKDHYPTIADSTDVLLNVINTVIKNQEKKTKQNEQLRSQ